MALAVPERQWCGHNGLTGIEQDSQSSVTWRGCHFQSQQLTSQLLASGLHRTEIDGVILIVTIPVLSHHVAGIGRRIGRN